MSFAAASAALAKHSPAGRHWVVAGALSQGALAVLVLAKHLGGGRQLSGLLPLLSSAFAWHRHRVSWVGSRRDLMA